LFHAGLKNPWEENMKLSISLIAAAFAIVVGTSAEAQQYPSKDIKVIVPYGAGQATDLMCRVFLDKLATELGQTVVPENRPGAGGNIGGAEATKATPDGYTLLCTGNATHVGNPFLYDNQGFDPDKDLTPINAIAGTGYVLLTGDKHKGQTIREILALGTADKPLKVGVVSTSAHVVFGQLDDATDAHMTRIPYSRGNQTLFTDLMAGETDLVIEAMPSALGQVEGGRVSAVAVTTPAQSPYFPGVPTLMENGIDLELVGWNAFYAPAGTPREVIDTLNKAANAALKDPEVAKTLGTVASVPLGGSPEDLANRIQSDRPKWEHTIKALGLKAG
jgi:tripartite-type tricarboxylate transporter receptor subunit TctC